MPIPGGNVLHPGMTMTTEDDLSPLAVDYQIRWRGLHFGPGSFFGYKGLSGWEDTPGLTEMLSLNAQGHGARAGSLYANERIISFESQMYAPNPETYRALIHRLREATALDTEERPLLVRAHGETLMCHARVTGLAGMTYNRMHMQGFPKPVIQWTASDPRRYDPVQKQVTLIGPAPAPTGLNYTPGLDYSPGLIYGAQNANSNNLVNEGNAHAPVTIEIFGPTTRPQIIVDGWNLAFDTVLIAGERMVIEPNDWEASVNGVERANTISPGSSMIEDCLLPPGSSTAIFLQESGSGSARISWRNAYL